MSALLIRGENVPGIPGACTTRNFTYLVRGPLMQPLHEQQLHWSQELSTWVVICNVFVGLSTEWFDLNRSGVYPSTEAIVSLTYHDDVIKWKHFPPYWPFVRAIPRSPVNSLQKGQWRGALMFSLIWVWTNSWANNGDADDLRHHRAHYDVIAMRKWATAQHSTMSCGFFFDYAKRGHLTYGPASWALGSTDRKRDIILLVPKLMKWMQLLKAHTKGLNCQLIVIDDHHDRSLFWCDVFTFGVTLLVRCMPECCLMSWLCGHDRGHWHSKRPHPKMLKSWNPEANGKNSH